MQILRHAKLITIFFAACTILESSESYADELNSLRTTIRSQICPASVAKYDLIRGSCEAERARMAASSSGLSGNANETYNAFMRCQKAEDEQNNVINQYNAFMSRCEAAEQEKQQQAEKDRRQGEQKEPMSDLDRRLQQARSKAETIGRKSQMETQSAAKEAVRADKQYEILKNQEERRKIELERLLEKSKSYETNNQIGSKPFELDSPCLRRFAKDYYYMFNEINNFCGDNAPNREAEHCEYAKRRAVYFWKQDSNHYTICSAYAGREFPFPLGFKSPYSE